MILDRIFTASLIYAMIRSATPIVYAALCASITQQADILNIGTEGIMLVGARMQDRSLLAMSAAIEQSLSN